MHSRPREVNCRIGSLENDLSPSAGLTTVNCRIGSLEMRHLSKCQHSFVNCRIGSLETLFFYLFHASFS